MKIDSTMKYSREYKYFDHEYIYTVYGTVTNRYGDAIPNLELELEEMKDNKPNRVSIVQTDSGGEWSKKYAYSPEPFILMYRISLYDHPFYTGYG